MKAKIIFFIFISFSALSGADSLSGSLDSEVYICIPIHRGDRMTLTGTLSLIDPSVSGNPGDLMLTTAEGRLFLLKGELQPRISEELESGLKGEIHVRGIILYEGWKDRLPQLDVLEFTL